MLRLIKEKIFPVVKTFNGLWLDIGRIYDYKYANDNFLQIKEKFLQD